MSISGLAYCSLVCVTRHIKISHGLGVQVRVLKTFSIIPSTFSIVPVLLGSGPELI